MSIKKLLFLIAAVVLLIFPVGAIAAASDDSVNEQLINDQVEASGVYDAYEQLDDDTKELLKDLGLEDIDFNSIFDISFSSFISATADIFKTQLKSPFTCFLTNIAVIILCTVLAGINDGFHKKLSSVSFNTASTLFLCAVMLVPLGKCVSSIGSAVSVACTFMLTLFPILCVLAATSGKVFSSVALNALGVGCAQAVSEICSIILIPLFNCLFGISIVSCVASEYRLDDAVKAVRKCMCVVLGVLASVYFSVLALKSTLGDSTDTVGLKTAKVLVSDFVPVIGSAISDSIGTITSYIGVTKSVVGAFGIIAVSAIFLPVILQSLAWVLSLSVSGTIAGIFGLDSMENLLKGASSTVSVLLVILIFVLLLFVINLGVVLMIRSSV